MGKGAMKPESVPPAGPFAPTQFYQAVQPQPTPRLDALEVAKWGFLELAVIFILGSLWGKRSRPRSSRNVF